MESRVLTASPANKSINCSSWNMQGYLAKDLCNCWPESILKLRIYVYIYIYIYIYIYHLTKSRRVVDDFTSLICRLFFFSPRPVAHPSHICPDWRGGDKLNSNVIKNIRKYSFFSQLHVGVTDSKKSIFWHFMEMSGNCPSIFRSILDWKNEKILFIFDFFSSFTCGWSPLKYIV